MLCKKCALNFKKRHFEESQKTGYFQIIALPFGSMYFNETGTPERLGIWYGYSIETIVFIVFKQCMIYFE